MPSIVKLNAHCGEDKVLIVQVFDNEQQVLVESHRLEHGQEGTFEISGNIGVSTLEVPKSALQDVPDAEGNPN